MTAAMEAAVEKESFRGVWIPCVLDDEKLHGMETEGLLCADD